MTGSSMTLDFSAYITDRTKDFTGRKWVFKAINDWLADPKGSRIFFLAGDPGTGKSAVSARLVQMSERVVLADEYPHLAQDSVIFYQFCQAFNDPTLDPLRFVKSLSLRLAEQYPPFAEALTRVGEREREINVQQQVGTAASGAAIAGVVIEEMNLGSLSARVAFDRVVRQPLEQLCTGDFDGTILVLVDALDEALTYDPGENIVTLLGHATDHPQDLPSQVRFLLTSRPDKRVLDQVGKPTLDLIANAPDDADDVAAYARRQLHTLEESRRNQLADRIAEAGEGNFLYARYVLDDLPADIEQVEDLKDLPLPKGLDDVYRQFLKRELGSDKSQWRKQYGHLLGILTVARGEGLTREQLAGISELPQSDVDDLLDVCGQYLAGPKPDGPFGIYHQSFRDFLLDNDEYQVYPVEANQAIADFFLDEYEGDWQDCQDTYALQHTPTHLAAAIRQAVRRRTRQGLESKLVALLGDFGFLLAKLDRTEIRALIADYELALADASLPPSDRESLYLVQKALRLSAHILTVHKDQLAGQLTGRLLTSDIPSVQALLRQATKETAHPWLRPVISSLLPAVGPIVFVLSTHMYPVRAVAVTPDGRRAVSAAEDKELKVWDLQTGAELRTLKGHTEPVLAVAVGPDGRFAVSGSQDKTIRVWDLETGAQVRRIEAHDAPVSAVAITPDGRHIVSGSYDATLKVWDVEQGTYCRTFHGHDAGVNAVALTPDGSGVVSGSYDRTLKLWDLHSGQVIHTFYGHQDQVASVAIAPEGRWMVSASFDRTLKLWGLENRTELCTFSGHTDVVSSVVIGPQGQAISASWDRTLRVWDLASREQVSVLGGHSFRVSGVAVTPDGQRAVSASVDTMLYVWNLTTPVEPQSLAREAGAVVAIAFTPDGRFAVTCARDQAPETFSVWSLETAAQVHTSHGYLDYSPDGRLMLHAGHGQALLVRDLKDGTLSLIPLGGFSSRKTLFTPDGESLLFRDLLTPVIHLTKPEPSGSEIAFEGHTSKVYDVAVTPNGKRAITVSDDRTLRVWELDTGKALSVLTGHDREIWSIAVAKDGRTAVSSSDDRSVILWDLERQMPIVRFSADGALTACAISPDGKTVITGDEAGRMYVLRLEG